MPLDENSFIITDTKYNSGVGIDAYQGVFSLVACSEGNDGKIWPKWGYPQRREDGKSVPTDRPIPWKITLGDKAAAIEVLQVMISSLENESGESKAPQQHHIPNQKQPQQQGDYNFSNTVPSDDIPF